MATFRKIHVSFWGDVFVQELTPEQKYFYLYLMTNERTTQCGIYETSLKNIAFDTGYNTETVQKLLEFFQSKKKIKWSKETNEIAILNWLKFNDSNSPKVASCVQKELKQVKNRVLIQYLYSIDTQTQEEEEKEQEEEQEPKIQKTVEKTEEKKVEDYPLPKMMKIWMQHFPKYTPSMSLDYTALGTICQIFLKKQPNQIPTAELEEFTKKFAKAVQLHNFYKTKPLKTIANNIQEIMPIFNDPKGYLDDLAKPKEQAVLTEQRIILNDNARMGYPESRGVKIKL